MSKPGTVHAFFTKLAAAVGSSEEKPSLKMLHSGLATQERILMDSLQDVLLKDQSKPALFLLEVKDFGVGLPPLAHC